MRNLRRHVGLGQHGKIIVGVRVDETGRDDLAACVDLFTRRAADAAKRGDLARLYADIGGAARGVDTVDDGTVADDEIKQGGHGW